jgi:hypothetical protein
VINKLQVLGRNGHTELTWDPEKVEEENADALAVIEEAERIVNDAFARGQAVFRLEEPNGMATRINQFDRTAPLTVVVPRIAGG